MHNYPKLEIALKCAIESGRKDHADQQKQGIIPNSQSFEPHLLSGHEIVNLFFRNWYKGITFTFRKNIKVTNLMLAETISLLKIHSKIQTDKNNGDVDSKFISTRAYELRTGLNFFENSSTMKKVFIRIWAEIPGNTIDEQIENFCSLHGSYFSGTILVDSYLGSCQVFHPATISVDYRSICYESGYLYSCGTTIYMRRSHKVDLPTLRRKLYNFLQATDTPNEVPILVFSREQFPMSGNNDVRRAESNGINDLKFHLDKFFFDDIPVANLLVEIVHGARDQEYPGELTAKEMSELQRRLALWFMQHDSDQRPGFLRDQDGVFKEANATGIFSNSNQSILIQIDRPLKMGEPKESSGRYFLCFSQEYINRNQVFEIDESKPGWTAPVTIPHSLAAAMINLGRGALPDSPSGLLALDPFAGCGTFPMELLKFKDFSEIQCGDGSEINRQATMDNISLLKMPGIQRKSLIREISRTLIDGISSNETKNYLRKILNNVAEPGYTAAENEHSLYTLVEELQKHTQDLQLPSEVTDAMRAEKDFSFSSVTRSSSVSQKIEYACCLAIREFVEGKGRQLAARVSLSDYRKILTHSFTKEAINWLQSQDIEQRLIFFVAWKALLSNLFFMASYSVTKTPSRGDEMAFEIAEKAIVAELVKFSQRWARINFVDRDIERSHSISPLTNGISTDGFYSDRLSTDWRSIEIDRISYKAELMEEWLAADEWNRKFDLIVTDPPYGFNVSVGDATSSKLQDLYQNFFKMAVRVLKDGGQLVFCVPEAPVNGQRIPFEMTRDYVIKRVLAAVREEGRVARSFSDNLPSPEEYFLPPYYWESDRALRRAIIHFSIFDK